LIEAHQFVLISSQNYLQYLCNYVTQRSYFHDHWLFFLARPRLRAFSLYAAEDSAQLNKGGQNTALSETVLKFNS